jgi:hypothetical protein
LGSESETCVGSRVHLVGVSISFEKNFYRLPFTPPSLFRRIGPSHGTTANTPNRSPEQKLNSGCTSQTGVAWASRDEQCPRVNTPKSNSRSPESLHGFAQDFRDSRNTSWGVHIQVYVHQNFPNQEESKKSRQELL